MIAACCRHCPDGKGGPVVLRRVTRLELHSTDCPALTDSDEGMHHCAACPLGPQRGSEGHLGAQDGASS
jgi:hypothetical protein